MTGAEQGAGPGVLKVLVGNRKGGCGKSSLVANVGAELAASGYRVLLIDADQQGNLTSEDLGLDGDLGQNLAVVMQYFAGGAAKLAPIPTGRDNMDVIPGGEYLAGLPLQAATKGPQGVAELANNLRAAISDLMARQPYDIVLIDSGPGDIVILDVLLQCVDYLVIPSFEDSASIQGVGKIGARYLAAQESGAAVELLGVVLCNINPRATKRNERTAAQLAALFNGGADTDDDGGISPVFAASVREAKSAAKDARDQYMTAGELVAAAQQGTHERIASLRNGAGVTNRLWSRDGDSLRGWAMDYQAVTIEMLQRMAAVQSERV